MNRRGFLKLTAAAPVVAAAPALAAAQQSGMAVAMQGGLLGPAAYSEINSFEPYRRTISPVEMALDKLKGLYWAADEINRPKFLWQRAYRKYRESRWTKPVDFRDRDCRLIARKFGVSAEINVAVNKLRLSEEDQLAILQRRWLKKPAWLRERAQIFAAEKLKIAFAGAKGCGSGA